LYDLFRFASTIFDGELLRRLVVLKLWQVRDPFDPEAFFVRIRSGRYDWEDLQRLVRAGERFEPEALIRAIEARFAFLANLTDLERELIADAKSGWNDPLAERLCVEIRTRAQPA